VSARRPLGVIVALVFACLALAPGAEAADIARWRQRYPLEKETEIGRKAAEEIDREYGILDDPEQLARLQAIVSEIVAVSDRPDLQCDVKILKVSMPNAMAIPGGFIRCTSGLLDMCNSDDELAAVLAHEIAHMCNYHGMRQDERDRKVGIYELGLQLAAIVAALNGADPGFVQYAVAAGYYAHMQIIVGYSREYEVEADRDGLAYLMKTKYNPTGMLTTMERFADLATRTWQGSDALRDFDTHPPSATRVAEVERYLQEAKVSVNRAVVLRGYRAVPEEIEYAPGQRTWQICFGGRPVFQASPEPIDGKTAEERVHAIATSMNMVISVSGLAIHTVGLSDRKGYPEISFSQYPVLRILEQDAAFMGMDAKAYASLVREQLIYALDQAGREALRT